MIVYLMSGTSKVVGKRVGYIALKLFHLTLERATAQYADGI